MIEINISNNYSSTIELNDELINQGSLRANEFFITAEFAKTYEELTRYVCTFNFRRNDNVEINGLVATPVMRNSKWGWYYTISSKDITALDGDLHLTIKLNNLNEDEVITTTSFTLHVEHNAIGEEQVLINDAQYNALLDKFNLYLTKDAVDFTDKEVNINIDGSPKGVYANLSALQTAYPSGASGIYLTSDNGHWYYWNGSAWTDGGVYQAPEIADGSITRVKLDDDLKEKTDLVPQLSKSITEIEKNKISKPTTADNNKFPRAKNGNVEWVEQGLPTDEQTASAITNWLNEHPEATTTVQDHSLTINKLVNGTLGYVTPEMFGAIGDGVTDDTEAIQNALNASHVVIFGEKTYLIDGNHATWDDLSTGGIQPNSNTTLIMCNGTTLKAKENTTGFYHTIYIREGVDNVTIYGGKIKCYKDNLVESSKVRPQGHGIYIKNSSNVNIIGTEIYDAWGDGIIIDCLNTHCIRIEKCNIHDCRRQGISIIAGADIIIRDTEIFKISGTAPQSGIDIESSYTDHYISNVLIDNVYFHENAGAACYYSQCKNVTFTNCICSDGNMQAVGEVSSVYHYNGRYKTVKIDGNSKVDFNSCVMTGFVSIDTGICELHNCTIYDFNPNPDVSCNINVNGSNTQSVTSFYDCDVLFTTDGTYMFFVWGKGICKFFGCRIKTLNENGMTSIFATDCQVELNSCEVKYVAKSINTNMITNANRLIIQNSHIKSNSNIGFVFDTSWKIGNVFFANNIFDFPQYVVFLTSNVNPTDYVMTFVNNIRTKNSKFLYDNGNTFTIEQINNDMVVKVPNIVD